MLTDVKWNSRNIVIFTVSLSVGLGLQQVPDAMAFLGGTAKTLLTSGLLPAAFIAIFLNLLLPETLGDDEHDGGLAHGVEGIKDNSKD